MATNKNNNYRYVNSVGSVIGTQVATKTATQVAAKVGTQRGSYAPFVPYKPKTTEATDKANQIFLADYNNATQTNSLVDVLFAKDKGKAAKELWTNTINPLTHRDENGKWDPKFGVAALNTLVGAGEVLDIFANPIKGLLIDGVEGLKKSVNWDGTGRKNYDFNTGNWAIDFALEVVTDPANLISFGLTSIGKSVAKKGVQEGAGVAAKQLIKDALANSFKAMGRDIADDVAEEAVEKVLKQTITHTAKEMVQNTAKEKVFGQALRNNLITKLTNDYGIKGAGVDALITTLKGSNVIDNSLDKASITILKSLQNIRNVSEATDKFVFRAGMSTVGAYPAYMLIKKVKPEWGGIAKKIIDERLVAVANSPIAYKTREALATIRALKGEIDINTDTNELLSMMGRGEITTKELGDIVCAKVSRQTENIKKIIKDSAKKSDLDVNSLEVVNTMIKKETGFENIDEYVASLSSLKGSVSLESEMQIFRLAKLRDELRLNDMKYKDAAELTKLTEQKQALESVNKPRIISVEQPTLDVVEDSEEYVLRNSYTDFSKDNIETVIDKRIDRAFTEATEQGFTGKQRIKYINDKVDEVIDTMFSTKASGIEELQEVAQRSAANIKAQLKENFSNTNYRIRSTKTLKKNAKAELNIDVSEFNEAIALKLEEIDFKIDSLTARTKTIKQASATAKSQIANAYKAGEKTVELLKNVSKDVKNVGASNFEEMRNLPHFQNNTSDIIEWLDNYSVDKIPADLPVGDSSFEVRAIQTQETLTKFAAGETVTFDEMENAYHTLVTAHRFSAVPDDSLLDYINAIEPQKLKTEQVKIAADAVYLALKGEQVMNVMSYVEDDTFVACITDLCNVDSEFHRTLKALANSGTAYSDKAKALLNGADNFRNYIDTHNKIMQLHADGILTAEEVTAFRSSIENFALEPLMSADYDFDNLLDKIIDKTENYYNYAYVYNKSLSQDKILERNKVYKEKWGIEGYYHKADTDSKATYAIAVEELKLNEKYSGRPMVAFDIETTSLNDNAAILEIGLYDGTEGALYSRKYATRNEALRDLPSPSVLAKCYSELPDYTSRVEQFIVEHVADVPTTPKTYYEEFIQRLFSASDDTVLITHNGVGFDIPLLISRMQEAGVEPELLQKFRNATVVDNLLELRAKEGYIALNNTKRNAIRGLLREHIDKTLLSGNSNYFFDAGIKNMRNIVSEFAGVADGSASTGLPETMRLLSPHVKEFRDVIIEAGTNTPKMRYGEGLPLVSKNSIAELTPDMVQDEFKELIGKLGTEITTTRVLYNTPTLINAFGYTEAVNMNRVLDWFNVTDEDGFADARLMELYTKLGKQLDSLTNKLTNVVELQDPKFVEKLNKFISLVQEHAEANPNLISSIWIKGMRTDRLDPAANYAIAMKMYQRLKGTLPENITTEYADIVQAIRKTTVETKQQYKVPASVMDYSDSVKVLKDNIDLNDAINEMEVIQGANRVYSTRQQLSNNALIKTYEYVQKVQKHISTYEKDGAIVYQKHSVQVMDELCISQTESILRRSPEELQKYMIYHRAPVMFLEKDDVKINYLIDTIKKNEQGYKALGIEFYETNESFYIHFAPETKLDYFVDNDGFHATFNGNQIDIQYDSELGLNFDNLWHGSDVSAIAKEMAEITNGQSIGHLGNQLSKDTVNEYFYQLPLELQKKLNLQELTKDTMFSGFTFDTMNIGSLASRQKYNKYLPSDYTKLMANANSKIIEKAKNKNLIIDYFLDPTMGVSKLINQYGEDVVRERFLKDGNYTVMTIMQDKKLVGKGFHGQGYRIIKLDPANKKLWDIAKNEAYGAIIVPNQMYSEIYDALNTSLLYDNPVYKTLHQITYLTKLGQIATVGKPVRDLIESQLKAMIETKDVLGVIKNDFKAIRDLNRYKKSVCDILQLSEVDYDKLKAVGIDPAEFAEKYINNRFEAETLVQKYYDSLKDVLKMDRAKIFSAENKVLYFSQINKSGMDEATFDTLHTLLTESGTLGELPAWGKYTHELHKERQASFAKQYADGLIGDQMLDKESSAWERAYDGLSNFGNLLMTPAQYLDQVNRTTQYLTLMDSGFVNPTSAIGTVARTMFDASIKTDSERLMELAIPFYTFFKHNALYWATAVEENPWLARLFFDYLNKIQDDSQIESASDFEKLNNLSLQNAKLAGNLIISSPKSKVSRQTRISAKGNPYLVDVTERQDQVTLKLNLPFMEAYQLAVNPIGYFTGATNPVIQLALQSWVGNNPAVPQGIAALTDTYRPYNLNESGGADLQWSSIIPFVGPTLQRWGKDGYAQKQYEQTGFLGNLILPSVFGRLNRYNNTEFVPFEEYKKSKPVGMSLKQYNFIKKYGINPNFSNNYTKKKYAKRTYTKKTYPKYFKKIKSVKMYNPNNSFNKQNYSTRAYYRNPYDSRIKHTRWTLQQKYYPQGIPRKPRPTTYKLLYNSYGKSRIQYLGMPKRITNPSFAIRNYFSYTR